jgi:thymidine kinase
MELLSNTNSIDIIIGPMFSGKTTELVRRLTICAQAGLKVLVLNSSLDSRSAEVLSCHSNEKITFTSSLITSKKVQNLFEVVDLVENFNVIGIDEAQFFTDLIPFTLFCSEEKFQKKVIICGLNGDFERKSFGDILNLIPLCDNITKLSSFCQKCSLHRKVIVPALFSKRIDSDEKKTIVIGNNHQYIPVCRKCYAYD